MRKLSIVLFAGAFWVATAANAATLSFGGTLKLTLGSLPPFVTEDSGVATVTFSSGTHLGYVRLAGGFTASATTIPLTDPNNIELVTLIGTNISLGTNTLGQISGGGPLTQPTLAINGVFKLCFLTTGCSAFLSIPLQHSTNANIGVGIGGLLTVNGFGKGTHISVVNAPWQVDQAVITGVFTTNAMVPGVLRATENSTFTGFAHGPTSASSTGSASGTLLMVIPAQVSTNLKAPSNFIGLPISLRLRFLPEPGLLLLLGSGIAGLALLARNRMSR